MAIANALNTNYPITLGGTFATTAAVSFTSGFDVTFNFDASTNVTFPVSGVLATTAGASIPSVAQGDLLYGSAPDVLSVLAKDANATRYLSNQGTDNNPSWNQVNLANGVTGTMGVTNGGTGTATQFTVGSIVFAGASGVYSQDNASFFWDDSNNRLGIGTATPTVDFNVRRGASGATVSALVQNTNSSNAASNALIEARVQSGGGNPYFVANVDLTQAWSWGVDQADSNKWKLASSSTLASGTVMAVTTAGAVSINSLSASTALIANANKELTSVALTNGQLLVGSTGTVPSATTLTAADGIVITNAAASITVGLPISIPGRNMIFNGGMNVWQRGISFTPATYEYGPDRWQVGNNNASSGFIQVFDANTNSYLLRLQRNVGTSSTNPVIAATSLTNNMSVNARNNVLTLSFVASSGANFSGASSQMTVVVATGTGSDVSCITTGFTGQVNVVDTTQIVNATPTKYSFTTSAIGSSVTQVGVVLGWTPVGTAGGGDYLQISEVQLEIASTASNFEVVPYPQELQRCQYFYQLLSSMAGYASTTTAIVCTPSLQNAMRSTPTVGETGFLVFTDSLANYTQTSNSITNYMDVGFGGLLIIDGFVGLTLFRPASANFTVNSNRLTFDSELY